MGQAPVADGQDPCTCLSWDSTGVPEGGLWLPSSLWELYGLLSLGHRGQKARLLAPQGGLPLARGHQFLCSSLCPDRSTPDQPQSPGNVSAKD